MDPAWEGGAVEIEQDFSGKKGLLPCDDGVAARVGGVRPFHGVEPALNNVRRATTEEVLLFNARFGGEREALWVPRSFSPKRSRPQNACASNGLA